MNYRYGAILNFSPSSFLRAAKYFEEERLNVLGLLSTIEDKHSLIQEEFDIFNPNITFFIGPYPFDKDSYTLNINTDITIDGNNSNFSFRKEASAGLYYDNSASHIDSAEYTVSYLDEYFLTKAINSHKVLWLYDLSSDDFRFDSDHINA